MRLWHCSNYCSNPNGSKYEIVWLQIWDFLKIYEILWLFIWVCIPYVLHISSHKISYWVSAHCSMTLTIDVIVTFIKEYCSAIEVDSDGSVGGLLTMWNPEVFKKVDAWCDRNFLLIQVSKALTFLVLSPMDLPLAATFSFCYIFGFHCCILICCHLLLFSVTAAGGLEITMLCYRSKLALCCQAYCGN